MKQSPIQKIENLLLDEIENREQLDGAFYASMTSITIERARKAGLSAKTIQALFADYS